MTDTIIVGGGLFGQIIAAQLRADGQEVRVFDNREPLAGSGPAACLMKPSWFSALGKEVYEPSLTLLDRLYGVHDLDFDVAVGKSGKIAAATVHWCNPRQILSGPTELASILDVGPGYVTMHMEGGFTRRHHAKTIIVAGGIWSQQLIPGIAQRGQMGMALSFPKLSVPRGRIKMWAPYRQMVAFNRGDGLWVGDGSAIKVANWSPQVEEEVFNREHRMARQLADMAPQDEVKRLRGIRPYAKDAKPCLLQEVEPGVWVASGGAKNGTLAAGWAAHMLSRRLA
jgi:glycine/D-amino acid oxidase-like deaminating enzyme